MATMPYCRGSNIRALTWTLTTGTPLSGYGVDRLVDLDPSFQLWLVGTSIDARADQGSAQRVDGLVVKHHNFVETTTLRLQMHTDTVSWGGVTDVDLSVDVGPWLGRFAPHVYFNLAANYGVSGRTKRYVRFSNTDANTSPIQIGELLPLIEVEALTRGVRVAPIKSNTYGRSVAAGKKGPVYVHDRRTRDRRWAGGVGLDVVDRAAFDGWQDDSHGTVAFVCWPENDIGGEPIFARFVSPTYGKALSTPDVDEAPFEIQELSCGEAY